MHEILITDGEVLTADGVVHADVAISDGAVSQVGTDLGDAETVIHAGGAWVGPGFVDLHTHLREPGQEWK